MTGPILFVAKLSVISTGFSLEDFFFMTVTLSFRKKIVRAFDSGQGPWFFLLSVHIAPLETGHNDVQMKFEGTHIVFLH